MDIEEAIAILKKKEVTFDELYEARFALLSHENSEIILELLDKYMNKKRTIIYDNYSRSI